MIYVVLGMHKSGTTLVSQILHASGIAMGDFDLDVDYDQGNKHERAESLAIDLEILGTETYDVLDLPVAAGPDLDDSIRQRMTALVQTCEVAHADWGLKDPRMCLTYHLWRPHLPEHRIIAIYRDPAQVWPRFKWRGRRGFAVNLGRAYRYQQLWLEHNRFMLAALDAAGPDGSILLDYHELMRGDAELDRLSRFVGRDLVDLRRPDLYRSRSHPDVLLRTAGWWLARRKGERAAEMLGELQRRRSAETARSFQSD